MRRITISLPDDIADVLADEARRCRRSVSEIAREALIQRLDLDETKPREIPFAAIGASKEGDIARNFDKYLHAAWDEKFEEERRYREDQRKKRTS